jgi:hypothetical protein
LLTDAEGFSPCCLAHGCGPVVRQHIMVGGGGGPWC